MFPFNQNCKWPAFLLAQCIIPNRTTTACLHVDISCVSFEVSRPNLHVFNSRVVQELHHADAARNHLFSQRHCQLTGLLPPAAKLEVILGHTHHTSTVSRLGSAYPPCTPPSTFHFPFDVQLSQSPQFCVRTTWWTSIRCSQAHLVLLPLLCILDIAVRKRAVFWRLCTITLPSLARCKKILDPCVESGIEDGKGSIHEL